MSYSRRFQYVAGMFILPVVLGGCISVPGMYLGAQGKDEEAGRATVNEDFSAQADIYTINAESVKKMTQEAAARRRIQEARAAAARDAPQAPYKYYIAPQDVLRITVWNHPELTNPGGTYNELSGRVVNDDGTFFYPYIGQVDAGGRTAADIREEMTTRLARYIQSPQVEVSVQTYRGKRASVLGQVTKPGYVAITDVPLRVTDLITQAEGLTNEADLRNVTLIRNGSRSVLDLYALYYQGDLSQNVLLQAGDILNISENRFNKVFVLGEVIKPTSLTMPRGRLTLAEAISDAGGVDPVTSNASQVYVIRMSDDARPKIWHLNASSPAALILADAFDLLPRDVVYVDAANVTRFSRVINQIIPSATLLREGVSDARTRY